jgi:hypothetical protein
MLTPNRKPVGFHESEQDIANEKRIVEAFAKHCGGEARFMPKAYTFDAMIIRGEKCALVDARRRKNEMNRYPTLCLSLQKFISLKAYAAFAPTFYLVEWDDGMAFYEINEDVNLPISYMSRNSGNPRDNEPVVQIPINDFKRF